MLAHLQPNQQKNEMPVIQVLPLHPNGWSWSYMRACQIKSLRIGIKETLTKLFFWLKLFPVCIASLSFLFNSLCFRRKNSFYLSLSLFLSTFFLFFFYFFLRLALIVEYIFLTTFYGLYHLFQTLSWAVVLFK